jgi:transposase
MALVQEKFNLDPHGGHLFVFRGRRGSLLKVLWHDGQGMCLFAKRLERGRFIWPSPADGAVTITPAQLGYGSTASAMNTPSPSPDRGPESLQEIIAEHKRSSPTRGP